MKKAEKTTERRADVNARITDKIIAALNEGVRPWVQPWNNKHLAGRVCRPLRHNGESYSGINVLLLWSEAMARGYASSTWMTFRQAQEIGASVRKGETGSMVVYANRVSKTEIDGAGNEIERDIPFLKAYTVFNMSNRSMVSGTDTRMRRMVEPRDRSTGSHVRTHSSRPPAPLSVTVATRPFTRRGRISSRCRRSKRSGISKAIMRRWGTKVSTGPAHRTALIAICPDTPRIVRIARAKN